MRNVIVFLKKLHKFQGKLWHFDDADCSWRSRHRDKNQVELDINFFQTMSVLSTLVILLRWNTQSEENYSPLSFDIKPTRRSKIFSGILFLSIRGPCSQYFNCWVIRQLLGTTLAIFQAIFCHPWIPGGGALPI